MNILNHRAAADGSLSSGHPGTVALAHGETYSKAGVTAPCRDIGSGEVIQPTPINADTAAASPTTQEPTFRVRNDVAGIVAAGEPSPAYAALPEPAPSDALRADGAGSTN